MKVLILLLKKNGMILKHQLNLLKHKLVKHQLLKLLEQV